jgi:DnaJ-domain-containing protein 1
MMTNPLLWPSHQRRTPAFSRQRAPFRQTIHSARTNLEKQLELMRATNVTISSNATLTKFGHIAAQQRRLGDPGVAVYFTRKGQDRCLAIDRFATLEDNLHAIGLSFEAIRGLERYGGEHLLDTVFTGLAALPVTTSASGWWDVLAVDRHAPQDTIDEAFRRAIREAHPDAGGSVERSMIVQEAYRQATSGGPHG